MKRLLPLSFLVSGCLVVAGLRAAEDSPVKPTPTPAGQASEAAIRARLLEHSRVKANANTPKSRPGAPTTAPAASTEKTPAAIAASPTPGPAVTESPEAAATDTESAQKSDKPKANAEQPVMLPKVEVNRRPITPLEYDLYQQEKKIAQEKKLTTSSELDRALNDPKMSIRIFGGESTKYRTAVASERVSMMEAERDLIEAIAQAKTKEEKTQLQKELKDLKQVRRELEQTLR